MYSCPLYQMYNFRAKVMNESDHVHFMKGMVSYSNSHDHEYERYTSEQIRDGSSHIHFYRGETTVEKEHNHNYCGYTGPAVYMHDGRHYHVYEGKTSYEFKHFHLYDGMTSPDMSAKEV